MVSFATRLDIFVKRNDETYKDSQALILALINVDDHCQ